MGLRANLEQGLAPSRQRGLQPGIKLHGASHMLPPVPRRRDLLGLRRLSCQVGDDPDLRRMIRHLFRAGLEFIQDWLQQRRMECMRYFQRARPDAFRFQLLRDSLHRCSQP